MEDSSSELEQFRQQWRAEVSARSQTDGRREIKAAARSRRPPPVASQSSSRVPKPPRDADAEEDLEPRHFDAVHGVRENPGHGDSSKTVAEEPQSALEHYEKAVEREAAGNLGDSLTLYRKAFHMDDRVDQKYKNKHFPPSRVAPGNPTAQPSDAPVTVPSTAHDSLGGHPPTLKDLIAGCAGLAIEAAPPAIEGTPAPPCPLRELPDEILVHILMEVAIQDLATFGKLARVCKRMAYLVATEEQIWKRVCLGSEIGFGAMHYQWQRAILGGPLRGQDLGFEAEGEDGEATPPPTDKKELAEQLHSSYAASWHLMLRTRPRIRFNGCYISTVNYQRAGQASQSQVTWHNPVHIVTYYRYLRFFRDGTVISLLTTHEPAEVVHYLTKELQETHRGGAAAHLPSIFMQHALRGRWRLSTASDDAEADLKHAEGTVFIETEGVSDKYMYRMKLAMRSVGKGARNNKLVWQGFWNYNLLTDDFGEFTLRNDKAFIWSRVRSYGDGA